jgi:hypothetical protein
VLDPKQRLTVDECLNHKFLGGGAGTQALNIDMNKYNTERKKQLGKVNRKPPLEQLTHSHL